MNFHILKYGCKTAKACYLDVQDVMGYALHLAQCGEKAGNAKPLKGFKGTSVLEITDNYDSDTCRAIYTVKFKDAVYVLHAFQKKSKKGIASPKAKITNNTSTAIKHLSPLLLQAI